MTDREKREYEIFKNGDTMLAYNYYMNNVEYDWDPSGIYSKIIVICFLIAINAIFIASAWR